MPTLLVCIFSLRSFVCGCTGYDSRGGGGRDRDGGRGGDYSSKLYERPVYMLIDWVCVLPLHINFEDILVLIMDEVRGVRRRPRFVRIDAALGGQIPYHNTQHQSYHENTIAHSRSCETIIIFTDMLGLIMRR